MTCPFCGHSTHRAEGFEVCGPCGAEQFVSQTTGDLAWKRNGRVLMVPAPSAPELQPPNTRS